MNDELARVREWVQEELDAEHEAPWETRRYLQVVVLIDELLAQPAARKPRRQDNVIPLDLARRRCTKAPLRFTR